jgi:hypothetical protein
VACEHHQGDLSTAELCVEITLGVTGKSASRSKAFVADISKLMRVLDELALIHMYSNLIGESAPGLSRVFNVCHLLFNSKHSRYSSVARDQTGRKRCFKLKRRLVKDT